MTVIVEFILTFRMPAFFVVSGYFCFLTLKKYGGRTFLRRRIKRLVVPFFFTALLLNSFQTALLIRGGWLQFDWLDYLLNGGYVSHLWFLTNLTLYFLAAGLLVLLCRPVAQFGIAASRAILLRVPLLLLVILMPLTSLAILGLNKVGFPLYVNVLGVLGVYSILSYTPFFVFGIALGSQASALGRFCTLSPVTCSLLIVMSLLLVNFVDTQSGLFATVVVDYLTVLSQWLAVALCFQCFYRYCNQASTTVRFFSDSAYTVYLFHHLLVILLGMLCVYVNVPALLGFACLVVVVSGLTLAIHHFVIAKNKALLFMFNGQ